MIKLEEENSKKADSSDKEEMVKQTEASEQTEELKRDEKDSRNEMSVEPELNEAQNEEFKQSEIKEKLNKDEKPEKVQKKPSVQSFEKHAMGCLIGALVGDSCGSMYQFSEKLLSEVELDFCFTMPGGGEYSMNPGQVTDDGELMLCLMHGLTDNVNSNLFDLDEIVHYYKKWS